MNYLIQGADLAIKNGPDLRRLKYTMGLKYAMEGLRLSSISS